MFIPDVRGYRGCQGCVCFRLFACLFEFARKKHVEANANMSESRGVDLASLHTS
jgi:hypothetical protein